MMKLQSILNRITRPFRIARAQRRAMRRVPHDFPQAWRQQ